MLYANISGRGMAVGAHPPTRDMGNKKICVECKREFEITPQERKQLSENGFIHEPTRCLECRMVRRAREAGKPIYPFTCARCRRPSHIDIKPIPAKPLLCAECYTIKKITL